MPAADQDPKQFTLLAAASLIVSSSVIHCIDFHLMME